MCSKCEAEKLQVENLPALIARRKKIWQLDRSFHCSVVGTCLTLSELHQLCKKMRIEMRPNATDYDWHHSFVSIASSESFAAKTLGKYLDKKYKETIKQASRLPVDELDAFWEQSLDEDRLPAAYWALITHPGTHLSLLDRMYGEVHMLSHLSGVSLRVNLERLKQLEKESKDRDSFIDRENLKMKRKLSQQAALITSLEKKLETSEAIKDGLRKANEEIETLRGDTFLKGLQKQLNEAEAGLNAKSRRIKSLEQSNEEWKRAALESGDKICLAEMELQLLRKENQALEDTLERYLSQGCSSCENENSCIASRNLGGSCVLYVGGRDRQCAHFRTLVEENNGKFIHHDGGLNDGSQHLGSILPKADMIFCPIDCISHSAVNRVKRFCSRTGKPLVIMRRASLAAFTRGLSEVAA